MNESHTKSTSDPQTVSVLDLAEVRWLCESGTARKVREEAALTLGDVGRHLSISPNTVSAWERKIARPTGAAAIEYLALLRSLGVIELSRFRAKGRDRRPA